MEHLRPLLWRDQQIELLLIPQSGWSMSGEMRTSDAAKASSSEAQFSRSSRRRSCCCCCTHLVDCDAFLLLLEQSERQIVWDAGKRNQQEDCNDRSLGKSDRPVALPTARLRPTVGGDRFIRFIRREVVGRGGSSISSWLDGLRDWLWWAP